MNKTVETTIANLKKNGIDAYYVDSKIDVLPLFKSLLTPGETVAVGGSVTLDETGVLKLLANGEYHYLDRYAPNLTNEQRQDIFHRSLFADTYVCSSNAITEAGELYNVDGNANRVAAIAYGPKQVILVVGINKIVPDLAAAVHRVKTVAAPLNSKRLNCDTYCAVAGHCMGLEGAMTDGCASPQRICVHYLVSGKQRNTGRIKVILVGELCGY